MRFHKVFRLYFFVCPFNILIVIHFYNFFKYFRTNFLKNIGCVTELKHFFTFSKRGCAFLKLNGAWIAFFLPMRYTIGSEVNNDGFSGKRKTSLRFKKGKRNAQKQVADRLGIQPKKKTDDYQDTFCIKITVRFWCGRQELKTSSKCKISLFSRLVSFEHHNAHQKFFEN